MLKSLSVSDLSKPETYKDHPKLETFCRQYCNRYFSDLGHETRAAAREAVFAGEHAETIAGAWNTMVADQEETDQQNAEYAEKIKKIKPLDGYKLSAEGDKLIIAGPYNNELPARLRRKEGYWDRDRKVWVLPLSAVTSMQRIFNNVRKKTTEKAEVNHQAEIEQWLGYVEEKAPTGYLYWNGVDKLMALGVEKHPEYKARLDAAKDMARAKSTVQKLERWLGYVEEAASQGRRYEKGIATLKDLGITKYPEYSDRLNTALENRKHSQPQCENRILFPCNLDFQIPINTPTRFQQSVLVFEHIGSKRRITEDDPSVHGSHLLGYEYEMGQYYYFRKATSEEIAQLEVQEEKEKIAAEAVAARQAELQAIKDFIIENGEFPSGSNCPEGDRCHDTQSLYGTGDWFVVGDEWVWYVRNNGMDGDCWANNNVRTGGAGALGWRIPYDTGIVEKIISIEKRSNHETT